MMRIPALPLLALAATALAGCATPRPRDSADGPLLGPADPFAVRTAALLWPGASSAILLGDPSLRASAGPYALEWRGRCGGEAMPAGRFGRGAPGSPNVRWRGDGARATWRMELAPVAVEVGGATHLLASIELTVEGHSESPEPVELVTALRPDSAFPVPSRGPEPPAALRWRGSGGVAKGPEAPEGGELRLTGSAARGRPACWRFLLAASPLAAGRLAETWRRSHADCAARAEREWAAMLAPAARLRLGDAALEPAVAEALLVLAGSSERVDGELRSIGSPFQYRDTWLRDAARQASALAQWGLLGTARELAADLLRFQGNDGAVLSQPGQPDGTGQAMWALDEVYGRDAGTAVPESLALAAARAWRWCEARRALVRERAPGFADLMPPADPRDNELAAGYLFGTDAWTLAGFRAGAALLARAGRPSTADSMRRAADAYAAGLEARAAREGGVPPRWSGPARDWGNFTALFPTRALPAAAVARARLLAAIDHAGPGAGLAHYGTRDTLHLYLGADLALDALLLGRPELWRGSLASMLAARTGTGGLPEMYCVSTRAFGWNLPPHATSAAALLVQVRQGLVFDAFGDTLRLTLGTLPAWWEHGSRLERAPTRWGPLDLDFRRTGDRVSWRWTAVPVPTVLALPPGARRVPAPGDTTAGGERHIVVPAGRDRAEVTCRFD
jgi:hypothetical protein